MDRGERFRGNAAGLASPRGRAGCGGRAISCRRRAHGRAAGRGGCARRGGDIHRAGGGRHARRSGGISVLPAGRKRSWHIVRRAHARHRSSRCPARSSIALPGSGSTPARDSRVGMGGRRTTTTPSSASWLTRRARARSSLPHLDHVAPGPRKTVFGVDASARVAVRSFGCAHGFRDRPAHGALCPRGSLPDARRTAEDDCAPAAHRPPLRGWGVRGGGRGRAADRLSGRGPGVEGPRSGPGRVSSRCLAPELHDPNARRRRRRRGARQARASRDA